MNLVKTLVILFFALGGPEVIVYGQVAGQSTPVTISPDGLDQGIWTLLAPFFDGVAKGHVDDAINVLLVTNGTFEIGGAELGKVHEKLGKIAANLGSSNGYSIIGQRKISDDLIYVYSLVYYQRQPIKIVFLFYKTAGKWATIYIEVATDINEEVSYVFKRQMLENLVAPAVKMDR